jgi:hypothetical protein
VRLRQLPVSDMHACRYELSMRDPPPSKVAAPHVCMFLEARALTESREPLYVRRVRSMGACVLEDAGRGEAADARCRSCTSRSADSVRCGRGRISALLQ